jgi:hypothetical protein
MRLVFHREVYSDVDEIMQHYERTATPQLAVDFYAELLEAMVQAVKSPESYSIREGDIRRVNLERFPYHF